MFVFLEPKTPITPELIDDVLKGVDDIQNDTSKPATVEITSSELKEKLIQKETMETGSVRILILIYYTYFIHIKSI